METCLPVLSPDDSLPQKHEKLARILTDADNLLVIQDLDGVCMGLVKDPLTRTIAPEYVWATRAFDGHFFVLTNGEHCGQRGVNGIVERAFGGAELVRERGLYLPGLAAGGVQWQDCYGNVSHPGVSEAELAFLRSVPGRLRARLCDFCQRYPEAIAPALVEKTIAASVLDNVASPTANLNTFYDCLHGDVKSYGRLQRAMESLMDELLQAAAEQGLGDSFFVHLAPNLGKDVRGREVLYPVSASDSGTTDFQFMLRGALKEVGVLAILNRYYHRRTGTYPFGPDFNVRSAPHRHDELLALVRERLDPDLMPVTIAVGDTVTSRAETVHGSNEFRRGGSDRGFLELVQAIGRAIGRDNIVVYVDSSGGEVKNRKPLVLSNDGNTVIAGPGDPSDRDDPLAIDIVFPGGHKQYTTLLQTAARDRTTKRDGR
ncbi:glucosylglycerol 3-phosphatase [Rubidibacter lacunae KORDI 51-2]|uniref:Glucosylglycerol 3-phosphatase n=1 Tax=Rubidibacter lacunae KORDI 51-2 TaxID=582515 RepID=U5DNW0_9CHRO|nr:glucosylglycerol 3-phosphatase [Rubidibacter lacunae]ERN41395.1 glucosylglycerol 3-phosphatase [Rubidibacter lacunae KORDI 51-2]